MADYAWSICLPVTPVSTPRLQKRRKARSLREITLMNAARRRGYVGAQHIGAADLDPTPSAKTSVTAARRF